MSICHVLVFSNYCIKSKVATINKWQVSKGLASHVSHDPYTLVASFYCHLTLYAAMARHKINVIWFTLTFQLRY